jgi:hypothetical protein
VWIGRLRFSTKAEWKVRLQIVKHCGKLNYAEDYCKGGRVVTVLALRENVVASSLHY